jgi:hypothetical protein
MVIAKTCNEELYNLHCLPNSIRVVRSTRTRWVGHTASSGSFSEIFTQKCEWKRALRKQRCRWGDNIKAGRRWIRLIWLIKWRALKNYAQNQRLIANSGFEDRKRMQRYLYNKEQKHMLKLEISWHLQ